MIESDHLRKIDLPYSDLRKYLSRAIGFYLFDDVEVPSLVWFTGNEDDILISCPDESAEPTIANVALKFTHAMWGDPLLESFFMPPGPSQGVLEGYEVPLMPFARQRTKRIWYTIYLALIMLVEGDGEQREWAHKVLSKSAEQLKDAPCY